MNKTHSGNAGAVWKRCTYRLFQHLKIGRKNRLKNSRCGKLSSSLSYGAFQKQKFPGESLKTIIQFFG
jgi:hypothetical protein